MLAPILAAALIVSGDIRTTGGAPIAGAAVEWNVSQKTTSNDQGHFTVMPASQWPADLLVSAHGFGTVVVPVPHTHRNVTLPPIALDRGATVRVHLHRGDGQHANALRVGLLRDDARTRWIVRRKLDGNDDIVIPDLARGSYLLLVDGPEPLQHATAKAVVTEGDVRDVDIELPAHRSHLAVYRGERPAVNAGVKIESTDGQWQSSVTTNGDGVIDAPIWDLHGLFEVTVDAASGAVPVMRLQNLNPTATVRLPARTVKGVVADTRGKPIQGAIVTLVNSDIGEGKGTVRDRTDSQGRFAFEGVAPGDPLVSVAAPAYLFRDAERLKRDDVKLTLNEGYPRDVIIEQTDGTPIAGAEVLCVVNGKMRAKTISSAGGRATIATPAEGPSTIYVLPSDGSLGIHRFHAPLDEVSSAPATIRIAPPASSLRVRTLSTRGATIPDVNFLLRYNGELIPEPVAHELERTGDLQFRTGFNGEAHFGSIPTGLYEFWPYKGEEDLAALLDTVGLKEAPVVVNVTSGENDVTIRLNTGR
ncbi:MAG TPA: carboxypeptidase-like regulatory domain-containing protein [Vicinamibacterales bacterium]